MKPKWPTPQRQLFGAHLSELLNPEHPLYLLAERIDWRAFDATIDACYAEELGRPDVNTRLMRSTAILMTAIRWPGRSSRSNA